MKKKADYQIKEREHFDRLAQKTGEIWWGSATKAGIERLRRRALLLSQELGRYRNPIVLEIGTGTGAFSRYVLENFPFLRLTGCDISPKILEIARQRCTGYTNANFELGDATSLDYQANSFDAVIGNSILHHLPIDVSLRECYRVLRPGGFIWFSEPNMMNPHVALEKNVRCIGKLLQATENETAFFRWSLVKKLLAAGFQDVVVRPFDFLHPVVPSSLIGIVDRIGRLIERTPILKEVSGSLLITANKHLMGNGV